MMPHNHTFIKTGDGSMTIHSSVYGQAMHTMSGAYSEALLKHVYPSKILSKTKPKLNVLDIGFGLGYNVLALAAEASVKLTETEINVFSLEKDRSLGNYLNEIKFDDFRDDISKALLNAFKNGWCRYENIHIYIIPGDARQSINTINNKEFHAVFHDPFSPAKNPELWTVDFFNEIRRLIAKDGIITTYSSAPQVRGALLEAGFIVAKGPSMGNKREGTLASMTAMENLINPEEIISNIKSTPYRDPGLAASGDVILQRRIDEMRDTRSKSYHQAHQG